MRKSSKLMKRCFATLLTAVMVVPVLPANLVQAAEVNYDEEAGAWGEMKNQTDYTSNGWRVAPDEDEPMPAEYPIVDVRFNAVNSTAGSWFHIFYKQVGQNYLIDVYHEDEGGEFLLTGKNSNNLRVDVDAPGARFLLDNGILYWLNGDRIKIDEINVKYKDLTHNIQTVGNSGNPTITRSGDTYKVEVSKNGSILLDGEQKGEGIYYIPESGKENEKQAAKDEVSKAAETAKQKVDSIPNLSDMEKADAKKEITGAADSAGTKIDSATTKIEVNTAVSEADKAMNDTVAKAEQLAKDKAAKEEQNKQAADSFIKDNLTDADGNLITTVTEKNIINILNAKEKWDTLTQEVKDMINQLLQAAGGQPYDALYNAAAAQSQKLDKDLYDNFDTGTIVATVTSSTTSAKLKWKKVAGADGYFVYTNICNANEKKNKLKKVKDITSASKTSYKKTKLKKNKWYKYRIVAYKIVNGQKMAIGQSLLLHSYTGAKTDSYSNPSKITVKKKTITVKVGKTAKMNAKMVMPKGKKLKRHTDKVRYIVSDKDIVTVNKKGKIKAKKKGTCTVYACAQNGVYKAVKVKVK
ncbi:MAG: DUF1542 domain-containing protein [Clostridium sp.]|nr:DUF1542 domain-containing protein [Clostridium sp.]